MKKILILALGLTTGAELYGMESTEVSSSVSLSAEENAKLAELEASMESFAILSLEKFKKFLMHGESPYNVKVKQMASRIFAKYAGQYVDIVQKAIQDDPEVRKNMDEVAHQYRTLYTIAPSFTRLLQEGLGITALEERIATLEQQQLQNVELAKRFATLHVKEEK